jgi:hypothetical protein
MIDFSVADEGSADTTLSIAEAKQSLTVFRGKVDELVSEINKKTVDSEEECGGITSLAAVGSKLSKEIEKKRKELIAEPKDFIDSVNRFCKQFTSSLDDAILGAKRKIASYQTRVELERRKAEEAARKAAEDLQKKLNAEAKEAGVQPVTVGIPVMPEKKQTVRTEQGTSYIVTSWEVEITDEVQVPREYLSADMRKLKRAVESGLREIPGCRIFEEKNVRFRTA